MYESFFGFEKRPFDLTPNTHFLYESDQINAVIQTLMYGIEKNVGFMLLCGEVGSGKTTTIRALMKKLKNTVETSFVLNPLVSNLELIQGINKDFGLECSENSTQKQIETLNRHLLNLQSQKKSAVVIIDEAQNLSFEAFEMTRMLSNLETESQKLINIIFVGQPELEEKIAQKNLRQLAQRIQIHAKVKSLNLNETAHYIFHRITKAGDKTAAHFEGNAIKKIYKSSKGIPRLINNLCDLSLLAAFSRNTRIIDKKIINAALKEVPSYVYHT